MGVTVRESVLDVSNRADGGPWHIRLIELRGSQPGPSTAFVAGIYGDQPLGVFALQELERRLVAADLVGTVTVVAAANPPALAAGTRVSPDFLYLNRQFPGRPTGFVTDQIAYKLFRLISERAERLVHLHSGTATMALHYMYDRGDLEFTASFGYLPIILGPPVGGSLSYVAGQDGMANLVVEFGGGERSAPDIGVEGCLNILRYLGQLGDAMTGPDEVPVVDHRQLWIPSVSGALVGTYGTGDIGRRVEAGPLARIVNIATGEQLEEFSADEDGGLLLLALATPRMVTPGMFASMVGYTCGVTEVPGR